MVRIRLLGALAVDQDGEKIDPPAGARSRSLLGWLALHPGTHPRSTLAARFWPDVLDSSARASLRSAVWTLRKELGEAGDCVVATRDSVGLAADGVSVDALEFDALVRDGDLERAVALGDAELLPGVDDEWAYEVRDQHSQRLRTTMLGLAAEHEARNELDEAIRATRRAVALDPLDEQAARSLMRRLAAAGDRPGSIAAYERLRERLLNELRLSPAEDTRDLAEAIRDGRVEPAPAVARRKPRAPARPVAAARFPAAPPLVGREGELATLSSAWEVAKRGSGCMVAIAGDPGIGKTRLATEVIEDARSSGARIAVCAGLDLGGAAPLGLWAELLRDLSRELDPPPAEAAWPSELARLAPDLEQRFGREASAPTALAPDLERARLFEAMVDMVEWAATDAPLAILMEDLHAADAPSLELAAYVGRRIGNLPALIVMTRREAPRNPEVDAMLHALRSRGVLTAELALAPLAPDEVRNLARAVAKLEDQQLDRVIEAAEGNALLAVESARALAAGGSDVPASLRGPVRVAIASLPEDPRLLAELTAAAGRELDRAELTALPVESPSESATAVLDSGLFVGRDAGLDYRHALLREAAYADLPDPRRAWLHEQLAEAMAHAVESGGVSRAAEIAGHLRRAGRDAEAVGHLARAAADARAVAALTEAAVFLEQAVELDPGNVDLALELADVRAWSGEGEQAEDWFERAVDRLDSGDSGRLANAWMQRAQWYHGALCAPRDALTAFGRVLEILDAAGDDAPRLRAEALAGCAWAEATAGSAEEAEALLQQVYELHVPSDDGLVNQLNQARAFALIRQGRFEESYGPSIAAAHAAQRMGRRDLSYGGWTNAACAAACAGHFERSLEFAERGLEDVREQGPRIVEVHLLAARSHILVRLGRIEEAEATADDERALAELVGTGELRATADHDRGCIALAAGDYDLAESLLATALDAGAPVSRPLARLARAEALVRLRRVDDAEAELRATSLEPVRASDMPHTLVPRLTRLQGLVASVRGDRELAERRLEQATAAWRRMLGDGPDPESYAANLVDLGRPPVLGLVEPALELERVERDLESLNAVPT